jgi:hypothetical protein
MMTPERLRQLARVCRELRSSSQMPETRDQLAEWAAEFDADAEAGTSATEAPDEDDCQTSHQAEGANKAQEVFS